MPYDTCPKHGSQIVGILCEHVYAAVQALQPMTVYLKRRREWHTLCRACATQLSDNADFDVEIEPGCPICLRSWADATGSDYFERVMEPTNEFPRST